MLSNPLRRFAVSPQVLVLCASLVLSLMPVHSQTAHAIWAYIPQEIRMAEADLIVAGRIERLGKDVKKNGTVYEVGIIKPSEIIKGKLKPGDDIRLVWPKPNPGGLRVSTQLPTPLVGESSIWVMQADEKLPVYWATYPTDRQPLDKLKEMQDKMKTLRKITWSEAVDGLRIGVFVQQRDMRKSKVQVEGKPVKALAQMSAYILFWNSSKQSIQIVNYPFDNPITVALTDPDGKPIEVKTAINRPQKPPFKKHNFVRTDPGHVRTMGYGISLGMALKPGDYTLKMQYSNSQDGKSLGVENVWKGKASSTETTINVVP